MLELCFVIAGIERLCALSNFYVAATTQRTLSFPQRKVGSSLSSLPHFTALNAGAFLEYWFAQISRVGFWRCMSSVCICLFPTSLLSQTPSLHWSHYCEIPVYSFGDSCRVSLYALVASTWPFFIYLFVAMDWLPFAGLRAPFLHGRMTFPRFKHLLVLLEYCHVLIIFFTKSGVADLCDPAKAVVVCVNGSCYESHGLEVCVCDLPWKGSTCNEQMSVCTTDCGVNPELGVGCEAALCGTGKCTDSATPPYFTCACGDFFTGQNCEVESNPCSSAAGNPCGHGTCTFALGKDSGTVTCQCEDNWQVPQGATATTLRWGSSEVLLSPACTEQRRRGVAALPIFISSGEMIVWWIVFAISLLALVWCCYTVISDTCQRYIKTFSAMRGGAKAAKAVAG